MTNPNDESLDPAELRQRVHQLTEDLAWLEEHAAGKPDSALARGRLRLAAATVRNVLAPLFDGHPPAPLHLAVIGGAGVGKSTIANWLIGDMIAESNPQAGFTRHPVAYARGDVPWPAGADFLGPLERLERHESARLDEDVYQVRRLPGDRPENELLKSFVVWDCPDVTTWAASHYIPRVLEIAGLADVVVYVASDERYNDETPTEYLKAVLAAGKTVVAVLMKMRETDVPAFLDHFQKEVVSKLPGRPLALVAVPQLTYEQLAEPFTKAAKHRIPLVNQVHVLGENPARTRRHTAASAVDFLKRRQQTLLAFALADLAAIDGWRMTVQNGQIDFTARYRKEYLTSERFRRFDETLVRLLELLELPAVGQLISKSLNVLKMPYTFLRGWLRREPPQQPAMVLQERPVLEAALRAWIDELRKAASLNKDVHPLWKHIYEGFQHGLGDQVLGRFNHLSATFHTSLNEEVERTARDILADLERNPVALNTLRGTKFALDVGAVIGGVVLGGFTPLSVVLVPLAASVSQYLVDLLGENYVTLRREETRMRQQALFSTQLAQPLADWLITWPTSGGSIYERLQTITRRYPENVAIISQALSTFETPGSDAATPAKSS